MGLEHPVSRLQLGVGIGTCIRSSYMQQILENHPESGFNLGELIHGTSIDNLAQ